MDFVLLGIIGFYFVVFAIPVSVLRRSKVSQDRLIIFFKKGLFFLVPFSVFYVFFSTMVGGDLGFQVGCFVGPILGFWLLLSRAAYVFNRESSSSEGR